MIPPEIKEQLAKEPQVCARKNNDCQGRITWEHARHHGLFQFSNCHFQNKKVNQELALKRATKADIEKYPRLMWRWEQVNGKNNPHGKSEKHQ